MYCVYYWIESGDVTGRDAGYYEPLTSTAIGHEYTYFTNFQAYFEQTYNPGPDETVTYLRVNPAGLLQPNFRSWLDVNYPQGTACTDTA